MLIEKYLGYNPLQSPSKSQLLHSMGDARWIQPVMETAGLGRIYGGRGIFKATDTKRDTTVWHKKSQTCALCRAITVKELSWFQRVIIGNRSLAIVYNYMYRLI